MNSLVHLRCTLPLAVAFMLSGSAFAQNYHYELRIAAVTDPASAKMVTDPLRNIFNEAATPFLVYPAFNDATDTFDFYAAKSIEKAELTEALLHLGIVLDAYSRSEKTEQTTSRQ